MMYQKLDKLAELIDKNKKKTSSSSLFWQFAKLLWDKN